MGKISIAKRICNMINGLEEIKAEYRQKRGLSDNVTTIYLGELEQVKKALEHLWKQSIGYKHPGAER